MPHPVTSHPADKSPATVSELTPAERRANARYPITAAATVIEVRSQTRIVGRCTDLGPGGCYVDTFNSFPIGAKVGVQIDRETGHFQALATVVYSQPSMGMGLAFGKLEPEQEQILSSWVSALNGERMAKSNESPFATLENVVSHHSKLEDVVKGLITIMARRKFINESEAAALISQIPH